MAIVDEELVANTPAHWAAIGGIVLGVVVVIGTLSVCTYKLVKKRSSPGSPGRPSSLADVFRRKVKDSAASKAEKGFLKRSPTTNLPRSKTPDVRSPATSPQNPLAPSRNVVKLKKDYEDKDDKNKLSPTEKDEKYREKDEDDLKKTTLGSISFVVEYDKSKTAIVVNVQGAKDLALPENKTGDASGPVTCDPYIKLQLLPEKKHKVKTRVLRKTHNPTYDEIFSFYGIEEPQIPKTILHFVVLSFDRYSRDHIIGEVLYPLASVDLSEKEVEVCKEVVPRQLKLQSDGYRGEMLVSLCYQPAANRLTVVVLKARDLPKMDITGLSDPYVKIYLLYNGQRIAKKKTHVKKRTLNPVFNESFLFDVPTNEGLQNISLEFSMLDWDRMTKNDVIGKLELGGHVEGESESRHWNEVINCPRKQIAEWHKLKE